MSTKVTLPTSAIVNCAVNMVLLTVNAIKMVVDPVGALNDPLYPFFIKTFNLPPFAVKLDPVTETPILTPMDLQLTTILAILCAHAAVIYAVMLYHRTWEFCYMTVASKAIGVVLFTVVVWFLFPERASPPIALFAIWDGLCVLHLGIVLGTFKGISPQKEKLDAENKAKFA